MKQLLLFASLALGALLALPVLVALVLYWLAETAALLAIRAAQPAPAPAAPSCRRRTRLDLHAQLIGAQT